MIQGGDPTGTGRGGTSIYGQRLYVAALTSPIVHTPIHTVAFQRRRDSSRPEVYRRRDLSYGQFGPKHKWRAIFSSTVTFHTEPRQAHNSSSRWPPRHTSITNILYSDVFSRECVWCSDWVLSLSMRRIGQSASCRLESTLADSIRRPVEEIKIYKARIA